MVEARTQESGTGVLCIKNLSLQSAAEAAVISLLCCMKTFTSMVAKASTTSCNPQDDQGEDIDNVRCDRFDSICA
jgi:hypothetical protein